MKKLQQLIMAGVLTTMLGMSVFAGDIPIWGTPPPASSSSTAPGVIPIPVAGATHGPGFANRALTDVVLDLLQTMLSVF